ncbi:biotin/lipoyl-binding protein [Caballeronia sp. 15711]|uniref:HlyD family efflux transporter periplasmic adaptor subunit n=1 Tax=Caballeronia sp. 15711 TaxID=3391029 RepID=UPI0039E393ED
MKITGLRKNAFKGRVAACVIVALGIAALFYASSRSSRYPSTDDATIDADVVHIASPVSGRIVRLAVAENQRVTKGDVLFEVDPVPYQLLVAQTQGDLDLARGVGHAPRDPGRRARECGHRGRSDRQGSAQLRTELAQRSAANAIRSKRIRSAPAARPGASGTARCRADAQAGTRTKAGGRADHRRRVGRHPLVRAREAALALAQHSLDSTVVHAPHNGFVTGLSVLAGETVAPNQSIFTLIAADEWFAVANFRETALGAIQPGDCATVYSMIDRSQAIHGKVVGIGAGVADTDRVNLPRALPVVQQSVNWVRVAQRFPVRVLLDEPAARLVRVGASALVEVRHGAACR